MSRTLLKSTAIVSGSTFLSRILGFLRDMLFAQIFGAGPGTDAFFVAFKIPNFMRRLFAEGAFNQAFVPVLSEYKTQRSAEETRALIGAVSGALGSVLLALTLAALFASPLLVMLFAPGFTDEPVRFALTSEMLRITFPYLLFISLTALLGSVLNTWDRFAIPALTPIWLNVCLIGSALWMSQWFDPPIMALAWGVFAAGIVQLLFQIPFVARLGMFARPTWGWHDSGVRRILKLMVPALFGSSVAQINLLLDTIIASFLAAGSVSWLYYSDRLVEFPLGVFGIALATVILPSLSKRHAEADPEAFSATLDWGLRWVLLIGLPAAIGLMVLAGPLLATLFQYGEFKGEDVRMASLSLMAYGLGLIGFMLVKVLTPGFYARQDTRTPVRIGIIAMGVNMGANLLFVVPMVWLDLPGPHAGLALATAASAFVNAGLLYRRLRAEGVFHLHPGWGRFLLQLGSANGGLLLGLWWWSDSLDTWLALGAGARALWLTALVAGGGAGYFLLLALVGLRPKALLGGGRI